MKDMLQDINEKLKNIDISDKQKRKYMISKSKIRSVHSSLAIEANSLSLFDVENISENKQVLGRKDEVQEVKNAMEVYNYINEYNYKSESDLLKVHSLMMRYFDEDNGKYRNHGEGVKGNNEIIYMAPSSILVPSLMKSLFAYIANSDLDIIVLETINSSIDKLIRNSNFALNDIQNEIILLITNNNRITQREIANITNVNIRTIKRNFKISIDNYVIERIGSDKTGY